jgi:glutathione-regulated potassium-efflux system ancillary protein KefG
MAAVLILFAHPALEKSRVHVQLIKQATDVPGVTVRDLYEIYPDFDIDVTKEQDLLLQHDVIIWQHPFYWYSAPALIKQWEDLVLEHGWAYGSGGRQLAGKAIFNAISVGGPREAYASTGRNRFTIKQFLAPFDQTAYVCGMRFLPPFVVHGTHRLVRPDIETYAIQYRQLLVALTEDRIPETQWQDIAYLNDLNLIPQPFQY